MNQLMQFGNTEKTMSSLEIAELVESRHDKVKQSIERLASRAVIELPPMGEIKTATKPVQIYIFSGEKGKRDSYVVVAQICPEFTARIVDRWQELENQQAKPALPNFTNPAEAARAWAEQFEQKQAALEQLEAAKPAVEFVGRYVEATGNKGFRQVAKLLNAKEQDLRQFLVDHKIMYRLGGEWMPYQPHIDAARFVVKTGVADNKYAYNAAKFTPKGIAWLAEKWAAYAQEVAA